MQYTLGAVYAEIIQVEVKAHDKHYIKQTDGGKQVNRLILLDKPDAVRSENKSGNNEDYDARNSQPLEENRRQEYEYKQNREHQYLIMNWQREHLFY